MMTTSISVVIPCYNYAQYVGQAIQSVLKQTSPANQIIVLNDGSTDGSREVIDSFGTAIHAVHQANLGFFATVNKGYARSTSDIVIFLDADDLLLPDAISEVRRAAMPGAAKIQYDLELIDGEGQLMHRRMCRFREGYDAMEDFWKVGTYTWPVMSGNAYSRAFLDKVMPLIPPVGHDGVLNTIAPLHGPVITIPKVLGRYRLHGRNMSRQDGDSKHGAFPDFPRQIAFRKAEFELLHQAAERMLIDLPQGDPIDSEITFVNYRLMALKLGQSYPGSGSDSVVRLARRYLYLIWKTNEGSMHKLAHILWLFTLGLTPRALAPRLIGLRFQRHQLSAGVKWLIRSCSHALS